MTALSMWYYLTLPIDSIQHHLEDNALIKELLLDSDTFDKCKEFMCPEKYSLKSIQVSDPSLTKEDLVKNMKCCLLNIGNYVANCLEKYVNFDKTTWRNYVVLSGAIYWIWAI